MPSYYKSQAISCPVIGDGNCQFSNRAALKSAVDAYINGDSNYIDNGIPKDLTALNDIGTWCTSGITSMLSLFDSKGSFNEDINAWDTSSVTFMQSMFFGAAVFNQPIQDWDTSSVTTMLQMFLGAAAFNQPIGSWDT